MTYRFDPDWVVAPGDTLREYMQESRLTPKPLAIMCGRMPVELFERVLAGDEPITDAIAEGLAIGTGIPKSLWLNLERAYRAGLAAGKKAVT